MCARDAYVDPFQDQQGQQCQRGSGNSQSIVTATEGQADRCHYPQGGVGGDAADKVVWRRMAPPPMNTTPVSTPSGKRRTSMTAKVSGFLPPTPSSMFAWTIVRAAA